MKRFLKNKNTTMVLFIAIIASLILTMIIVAFFLPSNSISNYGNRLSETKEVEVPDSLKSELDSYLLNTGKATSTSVRIQGKIINIIINLEDETTLENAKKLASDSLEKFTNDILSAYDIQIYLVNKKADAGYTVIGYRPSGEEKDLLWTNNNTD